ncbi:hypothetical protein HJC23_000417 [Cyclotella cryptica]|uniref:Uncharacterized protein n=1 Tax=Cyclotella cryptica TaxID=29204 RepID=A0ABD3PNH1_9STRA
MSSTPPAPNSPSPSPTPTYVRTIDNWARLFAQSLAVQHSTPLRVAYVLPPPPAVEPQEGADGSPPNPADMSPTERHGSFADDVGKILHAHTSCDHEAAAVVCDMPPVSMDRGSNGAPVGRRECAGVSGRCTLYCSGVDGIEEEGGGGEDFVGNAHLEGKENDSMGQETKHDWEGYTAFMKLDESIKSVPGMKAGREAAMAWWKEFFRALENTPTEPPPLYKREWSVRNSAIISCTLDGYDSLEGATDWARETLELHAQDEMEHLYTWRELVRGETNDDLWNAGQLQLVREGGSHGFMRMHRSKKILEWTISPSYTLVTAQYFNDRYAYDGNHPNGFVGVGWSIMGIHDMG